MKSEAATDHMKNGPSLPSSSIANNGFIGPQTPSLTKAAGNESKATPQSPYSETRSFIQGLTPPPLPRIDIPPSPPGTVSNEINEKFQHFFELKKQDVHFNEKLARSSALKNPSLVHKLMDFAGIGEGSYDTTLPRDIWDPSKFESSTRKQDRK